MISIRLLPSLSAPCRNGEKVKNSTAPTSITSLEMPFASPCYIIQLLWIFKSSFLKNGSSPYTSGGSLHPLTVNHQSPQAAHPSNIRDHTPALHVFFGRCTPGSFRSSVQNVNASTRRSSLAQRKETRYIVRVALPYFSICNAMAFFPFRSLTNKAYVQSRQVQ